MPIHQAEPAKMYMQNLVTLAVQNALFNPQKLQHRVSALWADLEIVGQSHHTLHYRSTANALFTFELFHRAASGGQLVDSISANKFYESLLYPVQADTIADAAPPRVQFVWPNFISVVAIVKEMNSSYEKFALKGFPLIMRHQLTVQEFRVTRLTSKAVARTGLLRHS